MAQDRSQVVSSFTIIKGALIEESYAAFQHWDLSQTKADNLQRLKSDNTIGATSQNWLRDVAFVLGRRFEPEGRDQALIALAQGGCARDTFTPILLWHITRDEYLVQDFLVNWLFPEFEVGAFRMYAQHLHPYLETLWKKGGPVEKPWSDQTTKRVASGLLRMATDFGLLTGTLAREFASYPLPDDAFLYLLHAMSEVETNAHKMIHSPQWRMFLMAPGDVERELFRMHQFRRLEYQVAGSLAQLKLPCDTAMAFAEEMVR